MRNKALNREQKQSGTREAGRLQMTFDFNVAGNSFLCKPGTMCDLQIQPQMHQSSQGCQLFTVAFPVCRRNFFAGSPQVNVLMLPENLDVAVCKGTQSFAWFLEGLICL